jgi:hypothetical protein
MMLNKPMVLRMLVGAVLVTGSWGTLQRSDGEQPQPPSAAQDEKKDAKETPEKKSGTVTGTITAKGENFIEVKADGEEKGRRYVPRWVGGQPKDGGGPDKNMLKVIRELKVGSRVRMEWEFEERPRVVKVEVLQAPKDEKKEPKKDK